METWQIVGLGSGIIASLFGYTHFRISQVRAEAIDIADRNKRDVNGIADLVRAEFTHRTADLRLAQEQQRRESREDLKDIHDSAEKFREEIRARLAEMQSAILMAVRGPVHPRNPNR